MNVHPDDDDDDDDDEEEEEKEEEEEEKEEEEEEEDLSLAAFFSLVVLAMFTALLCLVSLLNCLHIGLPPWISPLAERFHMRLDSE